MTQPQRAAAARRLEASLAPAELADVRLVARRLRGETIAAIATDLRRPANYVAARSQKAAAQLALAVEPDVAQVLRELSQAGHTAQQLARRLPAGRSLVQLIVNEGTWPEPAYPTLRAMWLAGGT